MAASRRERIAGIETRLLEQDGDEPVLLLLHGWGDTADCWDLVLERLEPEGVRVVCADLPSHGEADTLARGSIMEQLDAFLAELVESHADHSLIVAGYSLGGLMALRLAMDPPPQLDGVVAMAPPGLTRPWWWDAAGYVAPFAKPALRLPYPVPSQVVRAMTRRVYRQGTAFNHVDRPEAAAAIERFTEHWGGATKAPRQLRSALDLIGELRDVVDLEQVELPLLVVWGQDDKVVGKSALKLFDEHCPQARIEVLEDCGHVAAFDAPDRVTELLLEFRAELSGAGSGSARASAAKSSRRRR